MNTPSPIIGIPNGPGNLVIALIVLHLTSTWSKGINETATNNRHNSRTSKTNKTDIIFC